VEGGLSGLEVKTGSLKSILKGGISFFTPEKGAPADEKTTFVLYDDYQKAIDVDKTEIIFHFARPEGLAEGVDVKYQGVSIGDVTEVKYGHDIRNVTVKALVDKGMEQLFRTDSRVWLVTADVSLSGIKNLDTLVKGAYIAVQPGEGAPVLELAALDEPPSMMDEVRSGLNIVLETPALGSLKPDSPVYYRQFRVGSVMGSALSVTAQKIHVFVNIDKQYEGLIHENTVFWNASGINVDAGLFSGIQINTESFESILTGGIALATPEGEAMGAPVEPGHHFILRDEMQDEWQTWNPSIKLMEK
jgi:paraquat-inducible protein B